MIELLQKFPALWLIVGVICASAIFWIANRKVFMWQAQATDGLVRTLKEQIHAITDERDDYRNKLHSEKELHGAAKLRIQEMELRPDVTALFKASEAFYTEQTKAMSTLVQSFQQHDRMVNERMTPIYESLETMGKGIQELLRRTTAKQ
jgi:hypothetical protein